MDPSALPAYIASIAGRVDAAASPSVLAMAHTYERAVKANLSRTSHPPFTETPSPPGYFPSLISGQLRRSVATAGGGGAPVAEASVAPHTIYASVQEYGRTIHSRGAWPMTWYNSYRGRTGWWSKHTVRVPARPYMRPTVAQCIGNGSLTRAAESAFEISVWGR